MESHLSRREIPDVSGEQRTLSEITKRIRKLRWMGMEDEAQKLQMQLACCGVRFPDSVLAAPGDTD
jgi:hypothetical protein